MRTSVSNYEFTDRNDLFRVIVVACVDKAKSLGNLDVMRLSLESLFESIRYPTSITIIDNGSDHETKQYLNNLVVSGRINRLVTNHLNCGKLNPLVSEFYATNEDLVTFSDCDVFFYPNWQHKTVELFSNLSGVGYVGLLPLPSVSIENNSTFWWQAFFRDFSIKWQSNIFTQQLEMFQESIWGHSEMSYKSREYVVANKNGLCFIPGAGHVVGTYYRPSIQGLLRFVPFDEWRGAESKYLDPLCDKNGYLRISTYGFYAMHLGNYVTEKELTSIKAVRNFDYDQYVLEPYRYIKPLKIKSFFGRNINGYRVSKVLRKIMLGV
jgi:hypothetical protein